MSQGCLELSPAGNSRELRPRSYPPPAPGVRELGIIYQLLGIRVQDCRGWDDSARAFLTCFLEAERPSQVWIKNTGTEVDTGIEAGCHILYY